MSKKPTELEAAALTSWTPAGQAALYHIHLAQQAELDEKKAIKDAEQKEKKARDDIRPEEVVAGEVVDKWIKDWCPALFDFLDLLAPPHLAIGFFALLHFLFWYYTPWYLHFLLPWPTTYFIPLHGTWKSMRDPKDRILWLSYWCIIGVIEYLEILLFRDQARSLIWWPKIKAISCIVLYSIIENDPILNSKGKPKGAKPVFGAIKLVEKFLPAPPKSKEKHTSSSKEKEEEKGKTKEKSKDGKDKKSKDKGKDKDKGKSKSKVDKKGKEGKDKAKDSG
ncbi:hypothetical protein IAU59_000524 [Kwoniella sp. CBS 9459]